MLRTVRRRVDGLAGEAGEVENRVKLASRLTRSAVLALVGELLILRLVERPCPATDALDVRRSGDTIVAYAST